MKIIRYLYRHTVNIGTEEEPNYVTTEVEQTPRYSEEALDIAKRQSYNGEYTIETIEDVSMTAEEARAERDKLLAETDWTQVLDAPIDAETREAYRAYRQGLRDIPEQEGFPDTITWPELPATTKSAPDPVDTAVDTLLGGETA